MVSDDSSIIIKQGRDWSCSARMGSVLSAESRRMTAMSDTSVAASRSASRRLGDPLGIVLHVCVPVL